MGLFGRLFGPKGDCSLEEAAELIGTSPETVRRLTEDGELKSASIDPLRFDKQTVDDFNRRAEEQHEAMREFYRASEEPRRLKGDNA